MPIGLDKLFFKTGSKPGSAPLEIDVGQVLILVGPNNSGKSLVLKEIERFAQDELKNNLVLNDITCTLPSSPGEVLDLLSPFLTYKRQNPGQNDMSYNYSYFHPETEMLDFSFRGNQLETEFSHQGGGKSLRQWCLKPFTVRMDVRNRFEYKKPTPMGSSGLYG